MKPDAASPGAAGAWSLRRRLLAAIVAASSVLWLASLGIVTLIAWHESNEVFDDALEESAHMVMAAIAGRGEDGLPAQALPGEARGRKVDMQYQVVADGRVVLRSGEAPVRPFVAGAAVAGLDDGQGFADADIGRRRWRVFVVRDPTRGTEVQVGQQYGKRFELLEELAEHLWLPVLAMLALLALVCWVLTGRVLKPLRLTASAIAAKTPDDLALVPADGQPSELLPIVQALNGVFGRLDAALQTERRFTADAAHELRTPLAALHMHVQLLQRQHPALAAPCGKLRSDIARATGLVDSLLTLARLDPLARGQLALQPVALAPLLEQLLTSNADCAAARGIVLAMRCDLEQVQADPMMLEIMLRNLVDNALRYCPAGSRVEVGAGRHGGTACITVRDNGPGVDEASRQRLAERFFRVLGHGQDGSGLGLSIVQRMAELHGLELAFGAGLERRGLGVSLRWP